MTTTELIKLLKKYEFGGVSGRPREISFSINEEFIASPNIVVESTGDGIAGAELDLRIEGVDQPND